MELATIVVLVPLRRNRRHPKKAFISSYTRGIKMDMYNFLKAKNLSKNQKRKKGIIRRELVKAIFNTASTAVALPQINTASSSITNTPVGAFEAKDPENIGGTALEMPIDHITTQAWKPVMKALEAQLSSTGGTMARALPANNYDMVTRSSVATKKSPLLQTPGQPGQSNFSIQCKQEKSQIPESSVKSHENLSLFSTQNHSGQTFSQKVTQVKTEPNKSHNESILHPTFYLSEHTFVKQESAGLSEGNTMFLETNNQSRQIINQSVPQVPAISNEDSKKNTLFPIINQSRPLFAPGLTQILGGSPRNTTISVQGHCKQTLTHEGTQVTAKLKSSQIIPIMASSKKQRRRSKKFIAKSSATQLGAPYATIMFPTVTNNGIGGPVLSSHFAFKLFGNQPNNQKDTSKKKKMVSKKQNIKPVITKKKEKKVADFTLKMTNDKDVHFIQKYNIAQAEADGLPISVLVGGRNWKSLTPNQGALVRAELERKLALYLLKCKNNELQFREHPYMTPEGYLRMQCANGFTVRWLEKMVKNIIPLWEGARLMLALEANPLEFQKVSAWVNNIGEMTLYEIMRHMILLNKRWFDLSQWSIIGHHFSDDAAGLRGLLIVWGLPKFEMECLKKRQMQMCFKTGSITLIESKAESIKKDEDDCALVEEDPQ